jgi:transposase
MIHLHLREEQRQELHRVSRQAVGRVALRAHMVLLSDRDYSVPQIATIHGCGEDVVRLWLHRYAADGVAGLADEPRSGRPPKDPQAKEIVDTQASQSPQCSGHVRTCWTVATLTAFLATRFRLVLSRASVRRALHATGWRWARPRLAPARKQDPQAAPKRAALAAAVAMVAQGVGHLLYLDECDLHLLPVLRAMWMKGQRVRVPTPGTNAKRAFFGALDAATGRFHTADHARKLAVHFVPFLRQLAQAYPTGPLYLAMDNVAMHDAKVVRTWLAAHPRVQVLWLPKYAAHEENPAERLWGLMKDDVAANRLAATIDELAAAARRFFRDLAPHPVALPSRTAAGQAPPPRAAGAASPPARSLPVAA